MHVYAECYFKLRALNPDEWLKSVWFTFFLKVNQKGHFQSVIYISFTATVLSMQRVAAWG